MFQNINQTAGDVIKRFLGMHFVEDSNGER